MIRLAAAGDAPFLEHILAVAADWDGATPRPRTEVMADPALGHYIAGWPKQGDLGVVAEEGHPVGAAWWRFFGEEDPGFGFVDPTTPEVSVGVIGEARGHGVGEELLRTLIEHGRAWRLPALSLSVAIENPAARLYRRLGFLPLDETVGAR